MKTTFKFGFILLSSALLFTSGCSKQAVTSKESFESPTITLSSTKIYLSEGQTYTLNAVTSDTSMLVFWFVRDTDIASVEDGVITGLSSGETVCYAQVGSNTAMCSVVVTPYQPDASLYLSATSDTYQIQAGESYLLPLEVTFGIEKITSYTLTAEVEDGEICHFLNGEVEGLKAGETTILLTATYLTYSDQMDLTIVVK